MGEAWRPKVMLRLEMLTTRLPDPAAQWTRAMLAEAPQTSSSWEFLSWTAGIVMVAVRLSLREAMVRERPLAVSATAMWLTGFATYLFVHTVTQLPQVHESWHDAWFPVVACLSLTLFPSVIAFGLWTCDNLARWLAVGFVSLDVVIALKFVTVVGGSPFRIIKIAADLAIMIAMFTPSVKGACRWPARDGRTLNLSN